MTLLRCSSVSARYDAEDVVRGVSVDLTPGVWAVVGPNGAGKSTLLRTVAGLHAPSAGTVSIDGDNVHRMSARARAARIGYVAQRSSVWAGFDVRTVVAMGRHALPDDQSAIDRAIEGVGLSERSGEPFRALSVGQQQRVTVARALAQLAHAQGGVLIADEPLSAQDPAYVQRVIALLQEFAHRGGIVIAALHDVTTALRAADGGILMGGDGRLIACGPAQDVFTPGRMEKVFGVVFDLLRGAGGPALVPTMGPGARSDR